MQQLNNQQIFATGKIYSGHEKDEETNNLSPDQLKEERGIADFFEGIPNGMSDRYDMSKIKTEDDLDEPDL